MKRWDRTDFAALAVAVDSIAVAVDNQNWN